jgi:hypothetical protein
MDFPTAEQDHVIPHTSDRSGEAPTVAINTGLLPTASQHCTRCGATLATDQRYCVECGERRGEPRLPFMDGRTPAAGAAAAVPAPTMVLATEAVPSARKSRFSPSATLVAGTATLVLALGVGVLIGNAGTSDDTSAAAPPVQVVTVAGGGGTAAPASTTAADTTAAAAGTKTTKASTAKADTAKAAAAKKAAAKKVSTPAGTSVPQAKTPVVTKGTKGSGPGYKNGKFTGDFFGG